MKIALWISVCLPFVCSGIEAQLNYVNPQQIKYDDEVPTYDEVPYKSSLSKEPLSNQYENSREAISRAAGSPYPQPEHFHETGSVLSNDPDEFAHQTPSQNHPQVSYRQPESRKNYPSQDHASRPKDLLPGHHRLSHASIIYPQVAAGESQQPNVPQLSLTYPKPAEPEYPAPHHLANQESTPDYKRPEGSQPSNSRVVRDPRLPLYFTMYEKRIVQDPVDKYGKGPWRYLTYGHGITYGSKEPGKVFERGYGYIRALGRDHCKLPENKCPRKDDDKPFEYEGRKEPYFGYRPH
ncbi:hypothetical protein HNY73_013550 [Argiope bruennichi]|uniref:Uncharacterized protein n=1 Tax=Argiope bruennichi TaxID=94029 RepID=A0A8T0EYG3_ARGBR|nr:hypothetical protein HNY73_013550 [Argiope bruennichi]